MPAACITAPVEHPGHPISKEDVAWASGIASRHARKFPNLADEFESAALFALADAATRYDPDSGVAFRAFAARRVKGAVIDAHRSWYGRRGGVRNEASTRSVSLHAPTPDGDRELLTTLAAPPPRAAFDELDHRDQVEGLCRRLPRVLRAAFFEVFGAGLSQVDAANKLRISDSRVSQIVSASLAFLRDSHPHGNLLMPTNGSQIDPRAAEILRRRQSAAPPAAPARCGACAATLDPRGVCRRCHPEAAAEVPREKADAFHSSPDRPTPEVIAKRYEDMPTARPGPPARQQPALTKCLKCGGRINAFNGKCPRCPNEVPPTRADVAGVTVPAASPTPEPAPGPAPAAARPGPPFNPARRTPAETRQAVRDAILALQARGIFPSVNSITKELGVNSVNSAMRYRRELVESGEVTIGPGPPPGRTPRPRAEATPEPEPAAAPAPAPVRIAPGPQTAAGPGLDPELALIASLLGLDPEARRRVLTYVQSR